MTHVIKQRYIGKQFDINRNATCVDSLREKKVALVLNLFRPELRTALEDEYGYMDKGAWYFLKVFNDRIMQPLLTVSISKWFKIKEALIFTSKEDNFLKCFRAIIDLPLNEWHPYAKELTRNKCVPNEDVIALNSSENIANETAWANESCEDSTLYFIDNEE